MAIQPSKRMAIALLVGIAIVLGACTRSASTPPPSDDSDEGTPSGLTSQQMTMEAVRNDLLTQTAQAAEGAEPTEEPSATPEPTEAATEEPEATVAATGAAGAVPASYTLKQGEHPYCIARRFDIDPNSLLNANNIDRSTTISPGLTLTIPQDTGGFPPPRALRQHPTTYTVQVGDTIHSIACLYGDISPEAIAQANSLTEPYDLSAGTVLDIP